MANIEVTCGPIIGLHVAPEIRPMRVGSKQIVTTFTEFDHPTSTSSQDFRKIDGSTSLHRVLINHMAAILFIVDIGSIWG
jgi:hypothetical protein